MVLPRALMIKKADGQVRTERGTKGTKREEGGIEDAREMGRNIVAGTGDE